MIVLFHCQAVILLPTVCHLPGKARIADNASSQILLDSFISMDIYPIAFIMCFPLQNDGCRRRSCCKNQIVICHVPICHCTATAPVLSAILVLGRNKGPPNLFLTLADNKGRSDKTVYLYIDERKKLLTLPLPSCFHVMWARKKKKR